MGCVPNLWPLPVPFARAAIKQKAAKGRQKPREGAARIAPYPLKHGSIKPCRKQIALVRGQAMKNKQTGAWGRAAGGAIVPCELEEVMEFKTFDIDGPIEITPRKLGDERGYFAEMFREDRFFESAGRIHFVQENQSLSAKVGTVRGLHFQSHPQAQGKLVRCVQGAIFDVAVDIRHDSPSFGRWVAVELTPEKCNQLWVPVGFAHGFCTLLPDTIVSYKVTNYYSPENDKGVAWDDAAIGVAWPTVADAQTLSAKDKVQPKLADLPPYYGMKD